MTYQELQKVGEKIHEQDFFQDGIYLSTIETWIADRILYIHEQHSNQMQYTGKNITYQPPICEVRYLIEEEFPREVAQKCKENLDEVYFK